MSQVRRVFVEKRPGFDVEARRLQAELADFLGNRYPELAGPGLWRIFRRYDAAHLDEKQFESAVEAVFSEPQCDRVFYELPPEAASSKEAAASKEAAPSKEASSSPGFGVEYLPGQYDQRADSAEQCVELVTGVKPRIKTADYYVFESPGGPLSRDALEAVKRYLINPVDSREAAPGLPLSLEDGETAPSAVPVLEGFNSAPAAELAAMAKNFGLAMTAEDLEFCRSWFNREGRDPTLAELRVLDTYWSDHCRHTTFNTVLEEIGVDGEAGGLKKALELYEAARREVYDGQPRPRTLMDMATIGARVLKKRGLCGDVDESKEINACTIKVRAEFDAGESEPWLLLFKNETHNHPTEIEPFGGAATCLGGAIRDPLSGRAFVHQAMRVSGGGDPRASLSDTLPGKLPQIRIAREAAAGYSSYGNQIGLATGQVAEFYHPGFIAKRLELGAVIGAVPAGWVRREEPLPGDVVILVGGRTGRDGIGGATGSSKVHTGESVAAAGAEVQKGNAVEERKLQRLFRNPGVSRLIKRCNDFGAGGVSVAVGELAAGLDIDLDRVPKKYAGLDGTELAISESQERMAVVTAAADADAFIRAAAAENLEAVVIAGVTAGENGEDSGRLQMRWQGKTVVDLSRAFLNTNGVPRSARAFLAVPRPRADAASVNAPGANAPFGGPPRADAPAEEKPAGEGGAENLPAGVLLENLERELASLRSGSRRGLQERFDGSIGAGSVLFPWGGGEQGTPECGMASLLPSMGKESRTASLLTFGYDPVQMARSPYEGAKGAVREALAKFCCLGGDPWDIPQGARLSLQEYFERPRDPETWGVPAAALLGALEAQLRLGVPAIGGKDSMSGNYLDSGSGLHLAVPPTLVCFAAGTVEAARVRSGALSGKGGNLIVLLGQSPVSGAPGDEWDRFRSNMGILKKLAGGGTLRAAYPVGPGGVAASLAIMAFGNMTGVEAYAESFAPGEGDWYQGSVLAELEGDVLPAEFSGVVVAGRTLGEPVFRLAAKGASGALSPEDDENPGALAELPLVLLRRAYEYPLVQVYPQVEGGIITVADTIRDRGDSPAWSIEPPSAPARPARSRFPVGGRPLVVLPVFPGTNCEWDMERAFRKAGARTRLVIFRNRNREDIRESIRELTGAIDGAQIIALSGGFSAGDEPDGSGKFIANVFRSPAVADSVRGLLEKRDGLILGICNGFQALIKLGLVPYGTYKTPDETMPTLTFNRIGRHVSRMVRTRVMSNTSPWLSAERPGTVHVVPVSHGEGRLVIGQAQGEALFTAGQVPFCYADAEGRPTLAEPDNPNGSDFAIEGLTSPDGRILGKMAHSERCGEYVHRNIPGNKVQRIFEAGVGYFR
jgi:phosphoribosylformylglycinamidine synthase